jgi:peptide/nickel transport system substrate-binding protein
MTRARSGLAAIALLAMNQVAMMQSAAAQEVRIGYGAAVTSVDPHFHALTSNVAIHQHLYEALVGQDERLGLKPELATAWRAVDSTTWEFTLRRTARWHDGTPFSAEDFAPNIERVANVPNSPGRFTIYTRRISAVEVVDSHTLRLRTDGPHPLLPNQMAGLMLVGRAQAGASTADFNNGRAAIGTGPYRFRAWSPGSRFDLVRNDAYDGEREPWERVSFLLITNTAARVAALRAGDVQLIDQVPTDEVAGLQRDGNLAVFSTPGVRNIYLYVDQAREQTPGVTDNAGQAIPNPLRDLRVRRALSLAINRDGIVRAVMNGQAVASGQLLPAGVVGHDPDLRPDPYDVERARRLLAEAGFPSGFRIVLGGPNDRYVNDERVLQAIAQGWARAGLTVRVEAQPSATFFGRAARQEFSVGLLGWGTGTGEPDSPLQSLIATADPRRGWGAVNRSGFSNTRLDALLAQALQTLDVREREPLYRQATRIAMEELAIIPLHHQANVWATRRGYTYTARNDERTMATELRPAR